MKTESIKKFFLSPLDPSHSTPIKACSCITVLALTILTLGIYIIPIITYNYFEHRKVVDLMKSSETAEVKSDKVRENRYEPLKITEFGYASSTTYHPHGNTPEALEEDTEGIIDFPHVFDFGVAYILDGAGHGRKDRAVTIGAHLKNFNASFEDEFYKLIEDFDDLTSIQMIMRKKFQVWGNNFANNTGTQAMFSLAALLQQDDKKYLLSVSIGDTSLFHVRGNEVEDLTAEQAKENIVFNGAPHVQNHCELREVESGDVIFGLSDGAVDYLSKDDLHKILSSKKTTPENFLRRIEEKIIAPKPHDYDIKNKYDPSDPRYSDDIGGFYMVVP